MRISFKKIVPSAFLVWAMLINTVEALDCRHPIELNDVRERLRAAQKNNYNIIVGQFSNKKRCINTVNDGKNYQIVYFHQKYVINENKLILRKSSFFVEVAVFVDGIDPYEYKNSSPLCIVPLQNTTEGLYVLEPIPIERKIAVYKISKRRVAFSGGSCGPMATVGSLIIGVLRDKK